MFTSSQLETWLPAVGWEGLYDVSDMGRVKNARTGHIRALNFSGDPPYPFLRLWRDGVGKTVRVHILVMRTFVGEPPPGTEVCHDNGDYADARLSNLEYGTRSKNRLDSVRHGTHAMAIKTHCSKSGHEFTFENTIWLKNPRRRQCRKCTNERSRDYKREQRRLKKVGA